MATATRTQRWMALAHALRDAGLPRQATKAAWRMVEASPRGGAAEAAQFVSIMADEGDALARCLELRRDHDVGLLGEREALEALAPWTTCPDREARAAALATSGAIEMSLGNEDAARACLSRAVCEGDVGSMTALAWQAQRLEPWRSQGIETLLRYAHGLGDRRATFQLARLLARRGGRAADEALDLLRTADDDEAAEAVVEIDARHRLFLKTMEGREGLEA